MKAMITTASTITSLTLGVQLSYSFNQGHLGLRPMTGPSAGSPEVITTGDFLTKTEITYTQS